MITWNQRLERALTGSLIAAGTTIGGLLLLDTDVGARSIIGLAFLNTFGAFAKEMGLGMYYVRNPKVPDAGG